MNASKTPCTNLKNKSQHTDRYSRSRFLGWLLAMFSSQCPFSFAAISFHKTNPKEPNQKEIDCQRSDQPIQAEGLQL